MNRSTLAWTLVAFFGASIVFGAVGRATKGESVAVSLGLQVVALVAIVGLIVAIVRLRG